MSAQQSTGPVTLESKVRSAQNAITHGLSSEIHLVRTQQTPEFEALLAQLMKEVNPQTTLETVLTKEIARASWRLERCARAEDAAVNDDNQPAIDRARASALNIILKATAELRRLQTNRIKREDAQPTATPAPAPEPSAQTPDSSFCKTPETPAKQPIPRNAPCPCEANRNQRSKKKYKQCCGKDAPPVMHHGAKKAA